MDTQQSKVKLYLETYAEENNVPIIRESERELLLSKAREKNPKRILEIGTAIGYSSLLLALEFPEAEIHTVEIDPSRVEIAMKAHEEAGVSSRITCHVGDASEVVSKLEGPFDFLYLDGPKGQYLKELKEIEPLLTKDAMICADNVLFRGLVRQEGKVPHRYRTLVMKLREYISYVEEKYSTTIYEEGDGLAVSLPRKDSNGKD